MAPKNGCFFPSSLARSHLVPPRAPTIHTQWRLANPVVVVVGQNLGHLINHQTKRPPVAILTSFSHPTIVKLHARDSFFFFCKCSRSINDSCYLTIDFFSFFLRVVFAGFVCFMLPFLLPALAVGRLA